MTRLEGHVMHFLDAVTKHLRAAVSGRGTFDVNFDAPLARAFGPKHDNAGTAMICPLVIDKWDPELCDEVVAQIIAKHLSRDFAEWLDGHVTGSVIGRLEAMYSTSGDEESKSIARFVWKFDGTAARTNGRAYDGSHGLDNTTSYPIADRPYDK